MGFFGNRVAPIRWTSAMLAISALLFAAAAWVEGTRHREPATTIVNDEAAESQEQGGHDEAGEITNAKQGNVEAAETGSHAEQAILGVNLENPRLVWGFAGVSILLAAVVARFGAAVLFGQATLALAILLAGVAAILDGREVVLQLARTNASVAGLAAATAIAHAAVVILALLAWAAPTQVGQATGGNTQ